MTNFERILETVANMNTEHLAQIFQRICENTCDCFDCPLHHYCHNGIKWVDWLNAEERPPFTKSDLKNGMFGRTQEGKYFVIVNEMLVYQDGSYDSFNWFHDDFTSAFAEKGDIDCVVHCHSFEEAIEICSKPTLHQYKDKILFMRSR